MQPLIDHDHGDRFPSDPSGLPEAGRPALHMHSGMMVSFTVAPTQRT